MYTPQALWTQAREKLDVLTVVFANRAYRILKVELKRMGLAEVGEKGRSMVELQHPALDWTGLARSMGVEATRSDSIETFCDQLESAMKANGPRLIEAVI
jgi:acetolactate synthase-1/2/3 large subunit